MADCQHEWRTGPTTSIVPMAFHKPAICLKCWEKVWLTPAEATNWPAWSEEDYWANLDAIEGELAPEIRRMREEGKV